jgi:hypothetical protein
MAMPPTRVPTATDRLFDAAAPTVIATSGRLVAKASRIRPPSADPRCSRASSASVALDSWMPATQITTAAATNTATSASDDIYTPRSAGRSQPFSPRFTPPRLASVKRPGCGRPLLDARLAGVLTASAAWEPAHDALAIVRDIG